MTDLDRLCERIANDCVAGDNVYLDRVMFSSDTLLLTCDLMFQRIMDVYHNNPCQLVVGNELLLGGLLATRPANIPMSLISASGQIYGNPTNDQVLFVDMTMSSTGTPTTKHLMAIMDHGFRIVPEIVVALSQRPAWNPDHDRLIVRENYINIRWLMTADMVGMKNTRVA